MRFAARIGSPQPQEPCREEAVETGNLGPAEIEIGGRGADRAVGGDERIGAGNLARANRIEHEVGMSRQEKRRPAARPRPDRASSWKRRCGHPASPSSLRAPAGATAGRRAWRCLRAPSSRERPDGGAPCRSTSRARREAPRRTASSGSYFSMSASTVLARSRSRSRFSPSRFSRFLDESSAVTSAPASASCAVLPPGAAQRSTTRRPATSPSSLAGRLAAASWTHHSPSA